MVFLQAVVELKLDALKVYNYIALRTRVVSGDVGRASIDHIRHRDFFKRNNQFTSTWLNCQFVL
jgi:hypothetical protein